MSTSMRSYEMLIGGEPRPGRGWMYTIPAREWIIDGREAFRIRRELERGRLDPEMSPLAVSGRCAWGDADDVRDAVHAAATAFPTFSALPTETRRLMIDRVRAAIIERHDEFVDVLVAEGHPVRLARWEIDGILHGLSKPSLDWVESQLRQEFAPDAGAVRYLVRRPDGVVGISPPQNAAASNSALGLPSLLAGNTLVVKAPRASPLGVCYLWLDIVQPILEELGAPAGTINVVAGASKPFLATMLREPAVRDIMFFGSSDIGLRFGNECVQQGKKPILELSGNDGFVVWKDADLPAAADAAAECFYGSAQICMVPKYVIVHPAVADKFIALLRERAIATRPGFPEDDAVLLSPVLKVSKFFDFLAEALEAGAEMITGGRRVDHEGQIDGLGLFLEPTILRVNGLDIAGKLRAVTEETFFPLLPVAVPNDHDHDDDERLLDDVLAFLNSNRYGLRNSFWTTSPAIAEQVMAKLRAGGQLKINDSHIAFGPVISSHGGTGDTGGAFGELNYPALRTTHLQGITVRMQGDAA